MLKKQFLPWILSNQKNLFNKFFLKYLRKNKNYNLEKSIFISPFARIYFKKLYVGYKSYLAANVVGRGYLHLGANSTVNHGVEIIGKVYIGNNVRIGSGTKIIASNHTISDPYIPIHHMQTKGKGIIIDDNVWLGANVIILDGVKIENNVVVGAGSVVTKNIEKNSIYAGNPAILKRKRYVNNIYLYSKINDSIETLSEKSDYIKFKVENIVSSSYNKKINKIKSFNHINGKYDYNLRHLCDFIELYEGLNLQWPESFKEKGAFIDELIKIQSKENFIYKEYRKLRFKNKELSDYNKLALLNVLHIYNIKIDDNKLTSQKAKIDFHILNTNVWKDDFWLAGSKVDNLITVAHMSGMKDYVSQKIIEINDKIKDKIYTLDEYSDKKEILYYINGIYRIMRSYNQIGNKSIIKNSELMKINYNLAIKNYYNNDEFSDEMFNACNVLDTAYIIYMGIKIGLEDKNEGKYILLRILDMCILHIDKGLTFDLNSIESLQGYEMWLSIINICCKALAPDYKFIYDPKGIHKNYV